MSAVIEITDSTFASEVLASDRPTLVDYWADWCSPCKQLAPILDELALEYGDRIKFCKLDTNANSAVAMQQSIMSLPTLQLFVGGELVESMQGGKSRHALVQVLERYL